MLKNRDNRPGDARCALVRLVHIPALADADGVPRVALEMPPVDGRRAALRVFGSLAAAVAFKSQIEGAR
ncbi:hypothetical protein [Roseomonas sp. BN140053]|uniref:hypothetical protein n=1 Tax=Roseomonas sp. BN140053 TaxID=3391898 RepID=UPI0039E801F1